jgi:phosphoribosylamine--glycine ligase
MGGMIMGDRVGLIGGGGREHSLSAQYLRDRNTELVAAFPGNGLMDYDPKGKGFRNERVMCFPDLQDKAENFDAILNTMKELGINHVNVAKDDQLSWGWVDMFEKNGIPAFGPTQKAARLEWDKIYARQFMKEYGIPHPEFWVCRNEEEGLEFLKKLEEAGAPEGEFYVKKADLTGGKGALYARNRKEAAERIKEMAKFGKPGAGFLIEDCIRGELGEEEASMFVFVDKNGDYYVMRSTQDNKRRGYNDSGPQTGGMGAQCPAMIIEDNPDLMRKIEQSVVKRTIDGMKDRGIPYTGVLYLALMIEKGKGGSLTPNTCEYNARLGDPENQGLMPGLIKPALIDLERACMNGGLVDLDIEEDGKKRIVYTLAAGPYPEGKIRGNRIYGIEEAMEIDGVTIFGGGVAREGNKIFADGGRILYVVTEGNTYREIRKKGFYAMSKIFGEDNCLDLRHDIAWRDLQRELKGLYQ